MGLKTIWLHQVAKCVVSVCAQLDKFLVMAAAAGEYRIEPGEPTGGLIKMAVLQLAEDGGASYKAQSCAGIGAASAVEALGTWTRTDVGVDVSLTRRRNESNYRGMISHSGDA